MTRVHPEPTPLGGGAPDAEGPLDRALGGVRAVNAHRDLRLLFALAGAQTFMRGAITVFTVVVAVELVGLGDPGVGVLNAALGAGAVVASAAAALLVGTGRLAAWFGLGVALWGAPLVVIGLFPSATSAMVMLAIVGAGNALVDVGGFTLIARIAPANVLARVFGVLESVAALGVGLGALVTPLIMDALTLQTSLVVLGLLTPTAVALSWRRLRALDAVIVGRNDELTLLRGVPLLDALPLPALETVASQLDHVVVPAGRRSSARATPATGSTSWSPARPRSWETVDPITSLGPGESFGEIALLRRVPRTATVRAVDELRLESLRGDRFLALMTGSTRGEAATSAHVDEMLHRFAPRPQPGAEPPR